MMKKTEPKGFTLVELLVVVAIIGLLATLSVLALGSARVRARDAKRLADVKTTQTALELYNNDQGGYPPDQGGLSIGMGNAAVLTSAGWQAVAGAGTTSYLPSAPKDPLASQKYAYESVDATGAACNPPSGTCASYNIDFSLEGPAGGLAAGPTCAKPPSTLIAGVCP